MKKLITYLNIAVLSCGLIGVVAPRVSADSVVEYPIEAAVEACISGQHFDVPGLGTFQIRHRGARSATCIGSLDVDNVTIPDSAEVIRMDQDGQLWLGVVTPAGSEGSGPVTVFLINAVKLQP